MNNLIEQDKTIREITANLRQYEADVKNFGADYNDRKNEVMRKAQNVIAMDPYVPSGIRDLAHQKMLNSEQINRVLQDLNQRQFLHLYFNTKHTLE